jgi:hypothetical protein
VICVKYNKAGFFSFLDFDELFRDIAEVREAVKKELARNFSSNKNDVIIGEDEEELVIILSCYPPANGANERSEICVVSRGGNFFKQ